MPTPVSALIHAATLVTAGLYLLLRSSPLLEYSSTVLLIITLTGATTAFFAATCGLVQNDLKRIIAFSTISQLGYMVMAVGLSQYNVALMHVVNHAFFKALLFLGAGAVFYSKDLIIELAYGQYSFSGIYAFLLGSITAGLTAFYSFRLICLVFLTIPNGPKQSYLNVHEANNKVIIPLFLLALFSIFFGFIFSDLFVGMASDFFSNALFIKPNNISLIEAEFSLPLIIKLLPALLSLFGASLAIFLYHKSPTFIIDLTDNFIGQNLYTFFNGKYFFDIIYNNYFINKGLDLGYKISKGLDRGIIEMVGHYGLSHTLTNTGKNISKLDTGVITTYSIYITLSLLSLIFLIFAPILIDTLLLNEIRLFIIYIAALIIVLSPSNIKF